MGVVKKKLNYVDEQLSTSKLQDVGLGYETTIIVLHKNSLIFNYSYNFESKCH